MCLVEAGSPRKGPDGTLILDEKTGQPKIFWFPKPQASCTLMASEGMVIVSQSASVKKAQAGMMEFTLINHPLDCPTCDKGGACELQDRAYEYGYGDSRFEFDRRHADKHYNLSENVVLDQERCIHCKRCVRYFEEVPGEEVLDFIERGSYTFIDSAEEGLPSNFSGNITDICPVGALLDNVSRFRGRNWEYDHTATVCTACSVGCSITVDARNGQLERIQGRENYQVNQTWLCDGGRFGHTWLRHERITTPMIREGGTRAGAWVPATWDEAIRLIRGKLGEISSKNIGLYSHADITLEEGLALERFAAQLGTDSVDHAPRYSSTSTLVPPTLLEVSQADFVLVLGADVHEEAPVLALRLEEMLKGGLLPARYEHGTAIADLRMPERVVRQRHKLVVFSEKSNLLHAKAGLAAKLSGASVLHDLLAGSAAFSDVFKSLEAAQKPIVILGAEVAHLGRAVLQAAETLVQKYNAKLLVLPAASNSSGLSHLQLVPRGTGSSLHAMQVGAALVSRLEQVPADFAGFLMVHDTHLTEAATRADVFLPAVSSYEKRGTLINLEGRALTLRGAAIDAGESVDLMGVIGALGDALNLKPEIRGVRSAQREFQKLLNIDLSSLPDEGQMINWSGTFSVATFSAATSSVHSSVTTMWKPNMLRGKNTVPQQAQELFVGGDD